MALTSDFPAVMQNARVDLSANISGRFSPEDWDRILSTAQAKLNAGQAAGLPDLAAWEQVILDFYHNSYWGFEANYRGVPVTEKRKTLGIPFILFAFFSMTATEMAIAWLGQRYTASDEPRDAYIFFLVLVLLIGNVAFFLWRTRHHEDKQI